MLGDLHVGPRRVLADVDLTSQLHSLCPGPSHLLHLCPGDELDVGAGDLGEVLQRPPVRAAELFFRPVRNFYARSGVFLRLGDILCVPLCLDLCGFLCRLLRAPGPVAHDLLLYRIAEGLLRPGQSPLHPDLCPAQDAAHHGSTGKLTKPSAEAENGVLIRQGGKGVVFPVHPPLEGLGDHALHDLLLALVNHGPGPLLQSVLGHVRQLVDAASHLHQGVEGPGEGCIGVGFRIVRAVRLGLLVLGTGGGEEGQPKLRICRRVFQSVRHHPGDLCNACGLRGGGGGLEAGRGPLGGEALPEGQESGDGLGHSGHGRDAVFLHQIPRLAGLFILRLHPRLVGGDLLVHVLVDLVERGILIELVVPQHPTSGLRDRLFEHCRRGAQALGELLQAAVCSPSGDLSPVCPLLRRLSATCKTGINRLFRPAAESPAPPRSLPLGCEVHPRSEGGGSGRRFFCCLFPRLTHLGDRFHMVPLRKCPFLLFCRCDPVPDGPAACLGKPLVLQLRRRDTLPDCHHTMLLSPAGSTRRPASAGSPPPPP